MAVASPARVVALRLLSRQRRKQARARDLLRGAHEMSTLGTQGRALVTRLVLGVNVSVGELDRRLDACITSSGGLEPRVRDALRIAAFEALYLDTPHQVVVSQGVELVRSVQPRASRMANAVLRRISDERADVDEARTSVHNVCTGASETCSVEQFCAASGYPDWLIERCMHDIGLKATAQVCSCALEAAPVYVAAGYGFDDDKLLTHLSEAHLAPDPLSLPHAWRVCSPAPLATSGLVSHCEVMVCDLAAQIVCRIAAIERGRILDIGQGRGTKSLLFATLGRELSGQDQTINVAGCDSIASKARISTQRMKSAGLSESISCTVFDARKLADEAELPSELAGTFDTVMVDAPCSGTGTLRRHPEIAWSLQESSLDPDKSESLPVLQRDLLCAAAARVAPGGSLVYATCSVLPVEGEDIVSAFLASPQGSSFARGSIMEAPGIQVLKGRAHEFVEHAFTSTGAFQTIPASGSCDGHYCARLVRRKEQ